MIEFIKTESSGIEYLIKKSGIIIAIIWDDCGTKFIDFQDVDLVLNSDDLREIANKLDELNYLPDDLDSWCPSS